MIRLSVTKRKVKKPVQLNAGQAYLKRRIKNLFYYQFFKNGSSFVQHRDKIDSFI